jgi:hypothetical protein
MTADSRPDDGLPALRATAADHGRAQRWADLLALMPKLEQDAELWPSFWAPVCSVAARLTGRVDARAVLDRAIEAGFHQPELHDPELTEAFGADPDWPQVLARMASNVPLPPVELLSWPTARPMLPLLLDRLPADRETSLGQRLPPPAATAWDTALGLLAWVSTRWRHANNHVQRQDAVEVLDRVDAGERFACVEYAVVLAQALNVRGIPARRVTLRMAQHHAGVGRSHFVAEAWIDELSRWVLLDAQNGATWHDAAGRELGFLELRRLRDNGSEVRMRPRAADLPEAQRDLWARYFQSATTTGLTWSDGPFVPTFQQDQVIASGRLVTSADDVEPDLSQVWAETMPGPDGGPALRLQPVHPFATGVELAGVDGSEPPGASGSVRLGLGEPFALNQPPGEYRADVRALTRYAALEPSRLSFVTR